MLFGSYSNLHNDECLIYIFISEVLNVTPSICDRSNYHCWYKKLRNQFALLLIDSTYKWLFITKINGKIPRIGVIDFCIFNS